MSELAQPVTLALPPVPAPDAPADHHARWFAEMVHILGTVAHDGMLVVENPTVRGMLSPQLQDVAAAVAVTGAAIEGAPDGLPQAAPIAPTPESAP